RTLDDIEAIRAEVESRLQPLGHRVFGIINYDHFHLEPQIEDAWAAMVQGLMDRYYENVTRYTTSGFLRAKLGPALAGRGVAPARPRASLRTAATRTARCSTRAAHPHRRPAAASAHPARRRAVSGGARGRCGRRWPRPTSGRRAARATAPARRRALRRWPLPGP